MRTMTEAESEDSVDHVCERVQYARSRAAVVERTGSTDDTPGELCKNGLIDR